MFPHERSLVKRMEGKPFALVGINSDSDKEDLIKKNQEQQITWRSFWCGTKGTSGDIPSKWNVNSWPTLYFIDHKGVIRQKNLRDEKKMDEFLDKLVEEAEKDVKGSGTR
ncbi:MAG: thioredoxin-like domain-containing protein [Gemmatales bacterium]